MNAALDSRQRWLKTPTMGELTFYTSTHAFLYVPTCAMCADVCTVKCLKPSDFDCYTVCMEWNCPCIGGYTSQRRHFWCRNGSFGLFQLPCQGGDDVWEPWDSRASSVVGAAEVLGKDPGVSQERFTDENRVAIVWPVGSLV